ncbi:3'-5' exonuclease [Shinella sp.]|uniref:3'-5' exonuclease n=1 Tax=Shinella sp. TaxID=1870904 RepID=UPI003F712EE9
MKSDDLENSSQLEQMAHQLDGSGLYRVLRKLDIANMFEADDGSATRTGVFVDVETTGLKHGADEVIEIALLPFTYSLDGRIFSAGAAVHQLNEPTRPIPLEVSAITGLTDEIVKGRRFDFTEIEASVQQASLVVAHNAGFDRPFLEQLSHVFVEKPWACTMRDVPWREEGIEGRRLSDLLVSFGCFYDAHRALDDCRAGVGLLTRRLPRSGRRVLERLLETARESLLRIFAVDAPFQFKDTLRNRGYRWNSDDTSGPRAWWIDKSASELEAELKFLKEEILIYQNKIPIIEISAHNRHSSRV